MSEFPGEDHEVLFTRPQHTSALYVCGHHVLRARFFERDQTFGMMACQIAHPDSPVAVNVFDLPDSPDPPVRSPSGRRQDSLLCPMLPLSGSARWALSHLMFTPSGIRASRSHLTDTAKLTATCSIVARPIFSCAIAGYRSWSVLAVSQHRCLLLRYLRSC